MNEKASAVDHSRLSKSDGAVDASKPEFTPLADRPAGRVHRLLHRSTFAIFAALVTGFVRQTAAHTVCGMLTDAGLERVWHHSRAHRFFSQARWSADVVGLALADLIVAHLVPAGATSTVAVDDTLPMTTRPVCLPSCSACGNRKA